MRARFALSVFLLLIALPALAQDSDRRTETVRFPAGSTGTTISDSIRGYEYVDYILGAGAGQRMTVELATDNTQNYFNVLAPGEADVAFFIGSTSGKSFAGDLPDDGEYTIRVYMMRAAARRDEVASYELTVSIVSGSPSMSGDGEDAIVDGTPYHATGLLDCRFGGDDAVMTCDFGVIREGGGKAQIDITFPDGFKRTLMVDDGRWSSPQTGEVSTARFGDETEIIVDGSERFTIPDAAIFGG